MKERKFPLLFGFGILQSLMIVTEIFIAPILYFREDTLHVFAESGVSVGELNDETTDETTLTKVLLELMGDTSLQIKMYIEPIKNRYRGKQNSELYVAVPTSDVNKASLVWEILNTVCKLTYFKCSKE